MSRLRILVICHANTSRSIMAEALLRRSLAAHGGDHRFHVYSGGIAPYARDGALVSMDARLVLRDEGIHVSPDSVSTDLKRNRHLIEQADVILAMTDEQLAMLGRHFPEASGKAAFTLKQFAGGAGDIEDPVGKEPDFFANCLREIKACIDASIERLLSLSPAR